MVDNITIVMDMKNCRGFINLASQRPALVANLDTGSVIGVLAAKIPVQKQLFRVETSGA